MLEAEASFSTWTVARVVDEREVAMWRLPILAARMGEGIASERAHLEAFLDDELRVTPPG